MPNKISPAYGANRAADLRRYPNMKTIVFTAGIPGTS